jgi:hypothetical protein
MVIQAEVRVRDVGAVPASPAARPMRDPVDGRVVRVALAPRQVGVDVRAVGPAGAPRLGSQVSRVSPHHKKLVGRVMRVLVRADLLAAVALRVVRVAGPRRARVVLAALVSRVVKGVPDLRKMQDHLDQGRKEMTGNPKGLPRTSLA